MTTNEQRQAAGHVTEGVMVRAKRQARNLVDAWDDIHRASIEDRSWKRFRRLKWRRIATV